MTAARRDTEQSWADRGGGGIGVPNFGCAQGKCRQQRQYYNEWEDNEWNGMEWNGDRLGLKEMVDNFQQIITSY